MRRPPRIPCTWICGRITLIPREGIDALPGLPRDETWAEAYRRTPHGKPVEL